MTALLENSGPANMVFWAIWILLVPGFLLGLAFDARRREGRGGAT